MTSNPHDSPYTKVINEKRKVKTSKKQTEEKRWNYVIKKFLKLCGVPIYFWKEELTWFFFRGYKNVLRYFLFFF